ncbi:Lipoyl synthase [Buchnera aphidicola (Pterocallis alni)]|uniref:lipoyl synthase n=1 Tax=Buchnera aphidicola TaxID=9 RepID=UPI00346481FB
MIRNIQDKKFLFQNNSIIKKNTLNKPNWIKIKLPTSSAKIHQLKKILRKNSLHTVCEEALCPNLTECFNNKTATFMILGNICTRKCPYCNVTKGRPNTVDPLEPIHLSNTVFEMGIKYIVITSVNRDDLKDGGAIQFSNCIKELRHKKEIKIEILVPDFRNSIQQSIQIISQNPPDVFNHNLENVPRLYNLIRPGANYYNSLKLLRDFKKYNPTIPTKSGLMLGLGETNQEIMMVLKDLRANKVDMLTLGQYLQPSKNHIPVKKYFTPQEFEHFRKEALSLGFKHALCGPLVRSSYQAHIQQN